MQKCTWHLLHLPHRELALWWILGWRVMSSYLSKWDSNRRRFEPQSHLNNPWPTSTVPFLRDFPNLRAMPQGLELLADSVLTPNYNVVRANPLYNLTPSTWNSLPDALDYSARHGHQLFCYFGPMGGILLSKSWKMGNCLAGICLVEVVMSWCPWRAL